MIKIRIDASPNFILVAFAIVAGLLTMIWKQWRTINHLEQEKTAIVEECGDCWLAANLSNKDFAIVRKAEEERKMSESADLP